jgi:hypothetical protein
VPTVRGRDGRIVVALAEWESALLESFVGAAQTLLDSADGEDPALRRLFPDAYAEAEFAREFRELMGGELQQIKGEALRAVATALESAQDGRVSLTVEDAERWLQALTDIRLVVGTRLDVTEHWVEQAQRLDRDDPRLGLYAGYEWCSVLQELLVEEVSRAGGLDP